FEVYNKQTFTTAAAFAGVHPFGGGEQDGPGATGVERVVQEVRDRLGDPERVGVEELHPGLERDLDPIRAARDHRTRGARRAAAARLLERGAHQLGRRRALTMQLHAPALELRGVEDLVQHAQELVAAVLDHAELLALPRREVALDAAQEQ